MYVTELVLNLGRILFSKQLKYFKNKVKQMLMCFRTKSSKHRYIHTLAEIVL